MKIYSSAIPLGAVYNHKTRGFEVAAVQPECLSWRQFHSRRRHTGNWYSRVRQQKSSDPWRRGRFQMTPGGTLNVEASTLNLLFNSHTKFGFPDLRGVSSLRYAVLKKTRRGYESAIGNKPERRGSGANQTSGTSGKRFNLKLHREKKDFTGHMRWWSPRVAPNSRPTLSVAPARAPCKEDALEGSQNRHAFPGNHVVAPDPSCFGIRFKRTDHLYGASGAAPSKVGGEEGARRDPGHRSG